MSIFTGSCVALVTPFNDDGSINFDKFIELWTIIWSIKQTLY